MRMLVFGRNGQVATELRRLSGRSLAITAVGRDRADFNDPSRCADIVAAAEADVVVNAAAYTAVDKAEEEPELAHRLNAETPGVIAAACAARKLPLIHLSTDYVFSGAATRPWREDDTTGPLSVYGRTKLSGEQAVMALGRDVVILRTSWVHAAHGTNFVRSMLQAGAERSVLNVVADQYGGPTAAHDIAAAVCRIAASLTHGRGAAGIYHFCGAPQVNWLKFAKEIFRQSETVAPSLVPISAVDWPAKAARPMLSTLDCTRIDDVFGIAQPDWRVSLSLILSELAEPPELRASA